MKNLKKYNYNSFKERVIRGFLISQITEPLANKPGCTTRYIDSSPGTKLEYFLVSTVNSSWPILELLERFFRLKKQPNLTFDKIYEAQKKSPINRLGGKVNFGQLLMLFPIILSQTSLLLNEKNPYNVLEIIENIERVLKKTSRRDVHFLQKFVDLSREQSEIHHNRIGTKREYKYPVFDGVYDNIWEALMAPDFFHFKMSTEIRNGFPDSLKILNIIGNPSSEGILRRTELAYDLMLPQLIRPDITADCIVVAMYLIFMIYPEERFFL